MQLKILLMMPRTKETIRSVLIEELEKQNEAGDDPPPIHLPEKLRQNKILHTEVKTAIERLAAASTLERINITDNDAKLLKSRQGVVA